MVCSRNRASVYAVAADPEASPAVELRQVYVDNDDGESLFCAAWSWRDAAPLLAVGGARGVAKLVDCRSGRLDVALVGHGNAINDACFHPVDGALLLTASKDESVRLWNARTAVCVAVFAGDRGHRDEVLSVDAHLTGAVFCSAGMDNTVKVSHRAAQESEIPNFKGSDLGRFPLVSADFWTSDHLSERSRSADAFFGTRARGTLTLKRR
ncbi:hypothetical protein JL720_6613 [Aureococcus anophagefferens]|nr:hypothetical protein JL720_6613 [Aureococcus anophagefferens]